MTKTLVVGLGSAHGDDQAGWLMAEMLSGLCCDDSDVAVRKALTPLDVLNWLDGIVVLHLCDACQSVPERPMLLRLRWDAGRLVEDGLSGDSRAPWVTAPFRSRGSHDFSLPEVLRLAEQMQTLPKCVTLWAIAGSHFQPGDMMSEETRLAVAEATNLLLSSRSVGWDSSTQLHNRKFLRSARQSPADGAAGQQ